MAKLPVPGCPDGHFRAKQSGLTLIEVLVALAIAGIAMTAVIKAATQNIHATGYLKDKTIAIWVGKQVINETRAGLFVPDRAAQNQILSTDMLGHIWYWQATETETPQPRIHKIAVQVFTDRQAKENETPIITLESYVQHEA